ncbi:hypothetical protein F5I97DRAFT_1830322 [Phlebopus sp. FC_14]|nr:hypothetical protein F5I97DRAFT_1830322 [Phlebopus sp. FC_14]
MTRRGKTVLEEWEILWLRIEGESWGPPTKGRLSWKRLLDDVGRDEDDAFGDDSDSDDECGDEQEGRERRVEGQRCETQDSPKDTEHSSLCGCSEPMYLFFRVHEHGSSGSITDNISYMAVSTFIENLTGGAEVCRAKASPNRKFITIWVSNENTQNQDVASSRVVMTGHVNEVEADRGPGWPGNYLNAKLFTYEFECNFACGSLTLSAQIGIEASENAQRKQDSLRRPEIEVVASASQRRGILSMDVVQITSTISRSTSVVKPDPRTNTFCFGAA